VDTGLQPEHAFELGVCVREQEHEMLQDIPTPTLRESRACVLETERLMLRRPTLADVKAIASLANDRRIAENTRRLPHPYLQDHAIEFVRTLANDQRETVFLIENNHTPIGVVGVDWRQPDVPELGYWLGFEHWGQGYGTEAARAVIDFTFEEFEIEHLISGARVANPSSRNILEKCGFQWSGVELHRFEALGSSTPVDCFRLSRSVWSSLKNWANTTRRER
jgi:RimJ/RimL family protein N-acetyltransferase